MAALLNAALTRRHSHSKPASTTPPQNHFSGNESWLISTARRIDIRLLLVGSLLPDLIDKPIGRFFFEETFQSGRIFGHTLLFFLLITLISYYRYQKHRKAGGLVLAFGTFTHLICDQMWFTLPTLLWPLYGWTFPRSGVYWIENILQALLNNPLLFMPEILGLVILIRFTWVLVRRKRVYTFIRHGQV